MSLRCPCVSRLFYGQLGLGVRNVCQHGFGFQALSVSNTACAPITTKRLPEIAREGLPRSLEEMDGDLPVISAATHNHSSTMLEAKVESIKSLTGRMVNFCASWPFVFLQKWVHNSYSVPRVCF